jgi:signal peptidase II
LPGFATGAPVRWGASVHQPDGADSPTLPAVDAASPGAAVVPGDGQMAAAPAIRRPGVHWWLVLGLVAIDQASKLLVVAALPLYGSVAVIPDLVDIVHVRNPGVAFGFLNSLDPAYQKVVTTLLALAALLGIGYYARHVRPDEWLARLGLSVILGGALGNLIDRLRQGYVTDFVDVYWGEWHFWAFNVADASITIGAVLVFVDLLLVSRHASHPV